MTANYGPTTVALGGLSFLRWVSACSFKTTFKETSDTTSNITGTTSGRIWWNEDGLLNPEHTVSALLAYNAQNLETDPVRGQGEYLASLHRLTGTSDDHAFQPGAQDSSSRWSRSGSASATDLMNDLQATPR